MLGNRRIYHNFARVVVLCTLMLILAGCARRAGDPAVFTATSSATYSPQLPPAEARREANARAEAQARDQIMVQAGQVRVADGRSLEDVAAADATVRAELYDTVRNAHLTGRTISEEGLITITLALEKRDVQRIVDRFQVRQGK